MDFLSTTVTLMRVYLSSPFPKPNKAFYFKTKEGTVKNSGRGRVDKML